MEWDGRETATKIFQVYHFMEYIYMHSHGKAHIQSLERLGSLDEVKLFCISF